MSDDTETTYNGRVDVESPETPLTPLSEGFSPSPWSVLSDQDLFENVGSGPLEPIAIIGMSCRLGGSAHDPESLWDMLMSGRTAWTPGPGKRFNMKAFQDQSGRLAGTTNTGGGHFLEKDISEFDAGFFGIHPVEAMAMDPQQRLLLEVAYESFQNAGLSTESLSGSNTGVYVGQWSNDYHEISTRDIDSPPLYLITGSGPAITSSRISYHFNLRGPCFTVDTGCSSSLVALHQAVQSMRSGETSQCFVGGVNMLLDPQRFAYQSRLKMFSKEGRSFAFDSRANGYGRGEGFTGMMLKPLSAALRDGNHIRAVIRNSVLNQDGRTPGISVPSSLAQKEAIIKAYRQVNLDLRADYVEAHGTGTKVGDPIEASAISAALTQRKASSYQLPMGSIKANIGHTEGAAGLAALIKAVLMLEHGIIPPQANYLTPNPDIPLKEWKLRIPTRLERHNLRRISVNSFGYGGTNAHVVVDAVADALSSLSRLPLYQGIRSPIPTEQTPRIFLISAFNEKSCQRICRRLAKYLITRHRGSHNADAVLARLAYSLGKQTLYPYRLALVASNLSDLVAKLNTAADLAIPRQDRKGEPRIALVFSGQGAQYAEMGRELLKSYPSFVRSIDRARQQLARLGCRWDILSELCRPKEESRINEPAVSQPASTAIQLALVDLLAEFGISPSAVVGHSSGEIAAAYATRAISFEDAMTASYLRGKLTGELVAGKLECTGAMLAVGATPVVLEEHFNKIGSIYGQMRIACFNSPSSVTVSGDSTAIDQLKAVLDVEGTFNRKLATNGAAYHSHQMKLVEKDYAAALKAQSNNSSFINSSVRMFSSVTGMELDSRTALDGSYWVENLLSPVLFSQAVSEMCDQEYGGAPLDMIIEVGPHSQLRGPVNQTLKSRPEGSSRVAYASTLQRGKDAHVSLLECLGSLQAHGASGKLHELNRDDKDQHLSLLPDLPPYPFDHDRSFWHETRISKDYKHREHLPHELLGTLSPDVNPLEPRWRRFLNRKESPWLASHVVQGQTVFPAAGYLTMVVQAVRQHMRRNSPTIRVENILFRNISIGRALVLPEDGPDVEILLSLRPEARTARESSAIWNEFRIFSVGSSDKWIEHCRGLVQAESQIVEALDMAPKLDTLPLVDAECTHEASPQKFYNLGLGIGLDWRAPFNNLTSIRTSPNACVATARAPVVDEAPGGMGDVLHPGMLDTVLFHGLCSILILEGNISSTVVPTFIKSLRISNTSPLPGSELICTSTGSDDPSTYDVVVQDGSSPNRDIVIAAHGMRTTKLPGDSTANQASRDMCHGLDWVTYVDAWKPEHRSKVCKAVVQPGSAITQNKYLDALSLHYVQRAVRDVNVADIPDGHRQRFFEWMLKFAGNFTEVAPLPERPAGLGIESLDEAVLRLGPHLADVLSQKTDPLLVLTPDNLLGRIYNAERCKRCTLQMGEYCGELGKQNPGMKVLEVGAGTGSATFPILQALNGRGGRYARRYDYTDLSPGFFESAKELLGDLADVVEFGILDVERPGKDQGFEEGSYDLIIASNVIHATKHIDPVLANIRSLLKPGGKFVLMEVTQPTPYYNLLFGVFEGWWAGYDEGRRLSPLLSRPQWISKLKQADFSDPESCFEDFSEAQGGTNTVFVGSAAWHSTQTKLPPIQLVLADSNELGSQLVQNCVSLIEARLPGADVSAHSLSTPSTGDNIAVLLPDVARLLCDNPDETSWQGFKDWLLNARAVLLVNSSQADSLDAADPGLWVGLARCLRHEQPSQRLITLDLEAGVPVLERLAEVLPTLLSTQAFDFSTQGGEAENEFAEKDGQLLVSRFTRRGEPSDYVRRSQKEEETTMVPFIDSSRTLTAELGIPGLLDSIRWKDDVEAPGLGPDDVKIELRAASINFKDVLIAAGQLDGITEMRNDCSGVVVEAGANMRNRFKPGDRVCALYSRSYTNYPIVHGDCCQIVPDSMTFEEAAALPIIWTTVYYSLVDMGHLTKGDKLLIHSAAGAVGQAAIMLAKHIGAEIFVTVGSSSKRDLLHEKYGIPRENMFSSRTTAFHNGIKRQTNGYGVDVVLNSLSGEMFRQSCNLVAPFGRFVEIGRKDLMDDALMPMSFLLKNITFAYVDLTLVIDNKKPLARRLLQDVADLAFAGSIGPVTLTVMPISEIETAFRLIQAGKHTGKVILSVENEQQVKAIPPSPAEAQLKADATYLIVGGFGGLGRAFIQWMAEHGAKNILSISRSGAKSQQDHAFISELAAKGVRVVASRCDVSSQDQLTSTVIAAKSDGLPPIRGIIQSAMLLKDSIFEEMTLDQWHGSLAPKVRGTKNLHKIFGNNVDFFIMLSSVVCLRGNIGQSNYAAACSFQDAFARHRVAMGAPALSINVGPVQEVGFVSENPEVAESLKRRGLGTISVTELLALLNYAVANPTSGDGACAVGLIPEYEPVTSEHDSVKDRRFAHLVRHEGGARKVEGATDDVLQLLDGAARFEDAAEIICGAILQQLGKLIATPVESLSAAQSLDSYGVDSLVAVELRNWIGAFLQANVQLMVLRGTPSIKELAKIVTTESRLVSFKTA